jgi:sulfatase modifying factor 1
VRIRILRLLSSLFAVCAAVLAVHEHAWAITVDTVPIGNSGNAPDPADGNNASAGVQNYGAVAYDYRIGKYDVTVGQYATFLNAVAGMDTYGLYNPKMATDLNVAGIARSGATGSYTYTVIGSPNHPVTYVSWYDAARFCNWLQNGQPGLNGPSVPQDNSSTEDGAYSLLGFNDLYVYRNRGAKWAVPSVNEWYKAAYYDPTAGHYWAYATATNSAPTSVPPGNTPNAANFVTTSGLYAATGATYSNSQNYLTDVGAYSASPSPYGTFDQGGNVWQWTQTFVSASGTSGYRAARGGAWEDRSFFLSSTYEYDAGGGWEEQGIGFRLVNLPGAGDYNQDGVVDAADYTVWRDGLDGIYKQVDYDSWKNSFGTVVGSGAAAAAGTSAPEPATRRMLLLGLMAVVATSVRPAASYGGRCRPRHRGRIRS